MKRLFNLCLVFAFVSFGIRNADATTVPLNNPVFTGTIGNLQVANIAALRAVPIGSGATALANGFQCSVSGYYTANDGGGGNYVLNSSSVAADNGGTVISVNGGGTGRWLLQYAGIINSRWFGTKGDNSADDAAAIQAAIGAIPSTGGSVLIPTPSVAYKIASTINLNKPVTLVMDGATINYTGSGSAFKLTFNGASIIGLDGHGNAAGTGNPGPAGVSIINFSPSVSSQDAIVIGDANTTLSGNQIIGVRIAGTTNTRDIIRVNAQVTNLSVYNSFLTGPGSSAYCTGYGINLNGTASNGSGDFIRIEGDAFNWLTGGIRQGATNFTSGSIKRNQFASIAGNGITFPKGGGQSEITCNTFIHCNQTIAGAALDIVPTSGFATDLMVSVNSFQANGAAGAGTIDILCSGSSVQRIHVIGNQHNDVTATSGALIALKARNVSNLDVQFNEVDQTGGGSGAYDIDATNNPVTYWDNRIEPGTTEFVSSAGITNPFLTIKPGTVVGQGTISSQINGSGQMGVLRGATIQEESTDATASVAINFNGYQNGTTRFRDLDIFDGKHGQIAHWDGALQNVKLFNIPVYANNAAAVAGLLPVGYLYRTGADPDTVCIVH